ncbi:DUF4350 domain-containing protein [Arthrobacter sp. zg-Y1219]|uniref:DUF4350 domain-containing protein n=1 Tax=Arthrobacter sp. zg-Y1219 TaxID=3049067 RepID=UPI0024C2E834|nr:DUF4350 domain-containing protein [Arthrobacter sp. zg-Y1219]MDK1359550.1 DUF4350 domain-containing protein [Arthrobacter sp. zg-Y1219]
MTASGTASATPPQAAAPSGIRGGLRARLRAWRLWIILALVLCLVVILGVLAGSETDETALSPASAAPDGAMAAARILDEQGVEVLRPGSLDEAQALLRDKRSDTTLLLIDPDNFLNADQLAELDGIAKRQVLVEPSFEQLGALAPGIRSAGLLPENSGDSALSADCDVPDAAAAESIDAGGLAYRAPVVCFPAPGGPDSGGAYAADDDGAVVVLGNAAVLANETLASRGNAALTLRTLGSTGTLVWYQPTAADISAPDLPVDPRALLPEWVNPLLLWLLVVAGLAMFWRGRRLGPLAAEPLPVVVRSAETAEGRARLYQDGRASDRAAATLRAAALTRLAARLRLGPQSTADMVVRAAAHATGRSVDDVDRLLNRPLPGGDAELVQWSQDLQALEEEVTAS